jgi:hypothetical protein
MTPGAIAIRGTKLQGSGMVCGFTFRFISISSVFENICLGFAYALAGIPMIMAKTQTIKTEIVESKPESIIFKLQQEYTPKPMPIAKKVNSLVTLTLDEDGKVKYHKDMWNEKDYSHEGLGKIMKTLNGDHLTKITQPPESL